MTKQVTSAHVVLLQINHKDGGFKSKDALKKWLTASLNSNVNHAKVDINTITTLPTGDEPLNMAVAQVAVKKAAPKKKVAATKADLKLSDLLDLAGKAKSAKDAEGVLNFMREAFEASDSLKHLGVFNQESYMEGHNPFVRFELNRVISDDYVTMIRPEIRDGEFVVSVVTNHMLDGLGMMSQKWETAKVGDEELEDVLQGLDSEMSMEAVAALAKTWALAQHTTLIEAVGVPMASAREAAAASW